MSVSRRAWLSESCRAVAFAATAFVGIVASRASATGGLKRATVRVRLADVTGAVVLDDALVVPWQGGVRAFSRRCPHLGCNVQVDAGGQGMTCPCHGSRFALDGTRISGPAPRGLLPVEVELSS